MSLLVAELLGLAYVLTILVIVLWSPRSILRRRCGYTVIVHLATGASITGLLVLHAKDGVVLHHARHLDAELDVGGETYVPREQIEFMQIVQGDPRKQPALQR